MVKAYGIQPRLAQTATSATGERMRSEPRAYVRAAIALAAPSASLDDPARRVRARQPNRFPAASRRRCAAAHSQGVAATLAIAGLTGCRATGRRDRGCPMSSARVRCSAMANLRHGRRASPAIAQPVLGKHAMGRPVKLEGNPAPGPPRRDRCVHRRRELLGLYDPDRSQTPRHMGRPASWASLETPALHARAAQLRRGPGRGLPPADRRRRLADPAAADRRAARALAGDALACA